MQPFNAEHIISYLRDQNVLAPTIGSEFQDLHGVDTLFQAMEEFQVYRMNQHVRNGVTADVIYKHLRTFVEDWANKSSYQDASSKDGDVLPNDFSLIPSNHANGTLSHAEVETPESDFVPKNSGCFSLDNQAPEKNESQAKLDEAKEGSEIVIKNIPSVVKKSYMVELMLAMDLSLPYAFDYDYGNEVFYGIGYAYFRSKYHAHLAIQALNGFRLLKSNLIVEYKSALREPANTIMERDLHNSSLYQPDSPSQFNPLHLSNGYRSYRPQGLYYCVVDGCRHSLFYRGFQSMDQLGSHHFEHYYPFRKCLRCPSSNASFDMPRGFLEHTRYFHGINIEGIATLEAALARMIPPNANLVEMMFNCSHMEERRRDQLNSEASSALLFGPSPARSWGHNSVSSSAYNSATSSTSSIMSTASHSRKAKEYPPAVWRSRRKQITELYIDQDLTLKEVQLRMKWDGFDASSRQYKRKFDEWQLKKNVSIAEKAFVFRKQLNRKLQGKRTTFTLHGKPIGSFKLRQLLKGVKQKAGDLLGERRTPPQISYFTPPDQGDSSQPANQMNTVTDQQCFGLRGRDEILQPQFEQLQLGNARLREHEHSSLTEDGENFAIPESRSELLASHVGSGSGIQQEWLAEDPSYLPTTSKLHSPKDSAMFSLEPDLTTDCMSRDLPDFTFDELFTSDLGLDGQTYNLPAQDEDTGWLEFLAT